MIAGGLDDCFGGREEDTATNNIVRRSYKDHLLRKFPRLLGAWPNSHSQAEKKCSDAEKDCRKQTGGRWLSEFDVPQTKRVCDDRHRAERHGRAGNHRAQQYAEEGI